MSLERSASSSEGASRHPDRDGFASCRFVGFAGTDPVIQLASSAKASVSVAGEAADTSLEARAAIDFVSEAFAVRVVNRLCDEVDGDREKRAFLEELRHRVGKALDRSPGSRLLIVEAVAITGKVEFAHCSLCPWEGTHAAALHDFVAAVGATLARDTDGAVPLRPSPLVRKLTEESAGSIASLVLAFGVQRIGANKGPAALLNLRETIRSEVQALGASLSSP